MDIHEDRQKIQEHEFWQKFQELQKKPPFLTYLVIFINVAIYLLMVLSGLSPVEFEATDLIDWGASFGPSIVEGQWWRLASAMFLHGSILHLTMNMIALWEIGRLVEMFQGQTRFLLIYFLSGLTGSLLSLWHDPVVVSVGASGAIFGIYGSYIGHLQKQKNAMPKKLHDRLLQVALIFVSIMIIYGLRNEGIDNAAHIGGLIMGLILGWYLSRPIFNQKSLSLRQCLTTGLLVLTLAAWLPVTNYWIKEKTVQIRFEQNWYDNHIILEKSLYYYQLFRKETPAEENMIVTDFAPLEVQEIYQEKHADYFNENIIKPAFKLTQLIKNWSIDPEENQQIQLQQVFWSYSQSWFNYVESWDNYFSGKITGQKLQDFYQSFERQKNSYEEFLLKNGYIENSYD